VLFNFQVIPKQLKIALIYQDATFIETNIGRSLRQIVLAFFYLLKRNEENVMIIQELLYITLKRKIVILTNHGA
jgi:hypothetical protein